MPGACCVIYTNAIAIKQFFQRLSIELQRGNAALLFERDTESLDNGVLYSVFFFFFISVLLKKQERERHRRAVEA